MTFKDLLAEKGLTVYRLSKISDLPKSTLNDIATGKVELLDCSGRTLQKISNCLNIKIEKLLELEPEEATTVLPKFLNDSIDDYRKAVRKRTTLIDCYSDQLNSSINVAEVESLISIETAQRLRKRYFE